MSSTYGGCERGGSGVQRLRALCTIAPGNARPTQTTVAAPAGEQPPQPVPEGEDIAMQPVGVVVAPALEVLEVGAVVRHRVADHVAHRDPVALLEPGDEVDRGADLRAAAEDLAIGPVRARPALLDHLDPDRDVVEPDRVAAADAGADHLVNPTGLADD